MGDASLPAKRARGKKQRGMHPDRAYGEDRPPAAARRRGHRPDPSNFQQTSQSHPPIGSWGELVETVGLPRLESLEPFGSLRIRGGLLILVLLGLRVIVIRVIAEGALDFLVLAIDVTGNVEALRIAAHGAGVRVVRRYPSKT